MTDSPNMPLRSIYAKWERGDFSSVEWAHPEIEYVHADGPEPDSWRGVTEMAAYWRDQLSAWEGYGGRAEGYRELDDERVLVLAQFSGRGKVSGLELAQTRSQGANLFQVRDGKVTRLVLYWDSARALADLGLKE